MQLYDPSIGSWVDVSPEALSQSNPGDFLMSDFGYGYGDYGGSGGSGYAYDPMSDPSLSSLQDFMGYSYGSSPVDPTVYDVGYTISTDVYSQQPYNPSFDPFLLGASTSVLTDDYSPGDVSGFPEPPPIFDPTGGLGGAIQWPTAPIPAPPVSRESWLDKLKKAIKGATTGPTVPGKGGVPRTSTTTTPTSTTTSLIWLLLIGGAIYVAARKVS